MGKHTSIVCLRNSFTLGAEEHSIDRLKPNQSKESLNQDGHDMVQKLLYELMVKAKKVDLQQKSPLQQRKPITGYQ